MFLHSAKHKDETVCPLCGADLVYAASWGSKILKRCSRCEFHVESVETREGHRDNVPGYESLERVLALAYDQSARGKGKQRHANDKPFDEQPIMEIGRMVGLGGHAYQICKKAQEAAGMAGRGEHDAAKAEMLGVIVYAAAAYLLLEENAAPVKQKTAKELAREVLDKHVADKFAAQRQASVQAAVEKTVAPHN